MYCNVHIFKHWYQNQTLQFELAVFFRIHTSIQNTYFNLPSILCFGSMQLGIKTQINSKMLLTFLFINCNFHRGVKKKNQSYMRIGRGVRTQTQNESCKLYVVLIHWFHLLCIGYRNPSDSRFHPTISNAFYLRTVRLLWCSH